MNGIKIDKTKNDIVVGIMTSINLKERYTASKNTWLQDFDNVFMFGGDSEDDNLIRLKNVGEDYNSAFLKQQLGLKYMYEYNENYDWYCFAGCDHIIYKDKIMNVLKDYDKNKDYIIGQKHVYMTIDNVDFLTIAGGGGLFISNALMKKLYTKIIEFNEIWKHTKYPKNVGYPHGDVAIVYMVKKYFGVDASPEANLYSQHPNFYGNNIKPISLHYIKPKEMKDIYEKYK